MVHRNRRFIQSPISTPSHSKASSGQCRLPATLRFPISIRLIVRGASQQSPGRSDIPPERGSTEPRSAGREVIPCRRRGWFRCRYSACSTDIERSQNPRPGVIDQASAVHDGMDPDEMAPVRFQGNRLLPVPRNGFIGCDQEPPVKVAHEQSLVGNRAKALAGPFGRIGWMARRRLPADCGTSIRRT